MLQRHVDSLFEMKMLVDHDLYDSSGQGIVTSPTFVVFDAQAQVALPLDFADHQLAGFDANGLVGQAGLAGDFELGPLSEAIDRGPASWSPPGPTSATTTPGPSSTAITARASPAAASTSAGTSADRPRH